MILKDIYLADAINQTMMKIINVTINEATRHLAGSAGRRSHAPSDRWYPKPHQSSSQYLTILGLKEKKRIQIKTQRRKKPTMPAPALYPVLDIEAAATGAGKVVKVAELDILLVKNIIEKKILFESKKIKNKVKE